MLFRRHTQGLPRSFASSRLLQLSCGMGQVVFVARSVYIHLNVPYPNCWPDFNCAWTPGRCARCAREVGKRQRVVSTASHTRGQGPYGDVIFSGAVPGRLAPNFGSPRGPPRKAPEKGPGVVVGRPGFSVWARRLVGLGEHCLAAGTSAEKVVLDRTHFVLAVPFFLPPLIRP